MIVLDVLGTPAPKGSSRAMLIGGHARLVASSSGSNETAQNRWAKAIRAVALAQPDGYKDTPLAVTIEFRVARPATAKKRAAPLVKPDIDKLARCTLDALVTTKRRGKVHYGIIDDDSRIVKLDVTKLYAEPGCEGARITVAEWRPQASKAKDEAEHPLVAVKSCPVESSECAIRGTCTNKCGALDGSEAT